MRGRTGEGLSLVSGPDEPLINLIKEILVDDCYRLAGLHLRTGEAMVDIGANVGTFALAAARAFPQATIICVAPAASASALLEENVRRNGLSQVRTINAACGGASGEQVLYARQLQMNAPTALNTLYTVDNYGSVFAPITTVQWLGECCFAVDRQPLFDEDGGYLYAWREGLFDSVSVTSSSSDCGAIGRCGKSRFSIGDIARRAQARARLHRAT